MGDLNSKGNKNEVKGSMKETEGKVRGDAGDAMDDGSMHSEGRMDQAKGNIQKNFGKAEKALDPDNNDNKHSNTDE